MKTVITLLAFLLLTSHIQAQLQKLDGNITEAEIQSLSTIDSHGANSLMIDTSSQQFIKVALKSEKLYVASLCVCIGENKIMVMHASAALGDLTYTYQQNKHWVTDDKFVWAVRENDMTPETIEKRKQYFDDRGWIGSTMSMGNDGETEFLIDRKLFGNQSLSLAIGLMTEGDPENIIGIPKNDASDCAAHALVSGDPESSYRFDTSGWLKIQ